MLKFFDYIPALFSHWLTLMSAGPFLIDRAITWFWPSGRKWLDHWPHRQRLLISILLAGVFVAGFLAWKEERTAKERLANEKHSLDPDFLYQHGNQVAVVIEPQIDIHDNVLVFPAVTSSRQLDLGKEFEFRSWRLLCSGKEGASMRFGAMQQITYPNLKCRIENVR